MDILFVGYKNHALRLLKLVHELPSIGRIFVYHPSLDKLRDSGVEKLSKKIELTDNFDALSFQAAVIASPNKTHVDYIKRLSDGKCYIFCEKPPATSQEEISYLEGLRPTLKKKIYFNLNYRFTELAKIAHEFIANGKIGKPLHFNFVSTQGIAFKETFSKNWRFTGNRRDGVLMTAGIHYIDLCQWLMKSNCTLNVIGSAHSPYAGRSWDTCSINMAFENGVACNILNSYAAPFENTADLFFEDGILRLNDGTVTLCAPRDTFDQNGRFSAPTPKVLHRSASSLEYYNNALLDSLKHFFSAAEKRSSFDADYYMLALKSNSLLFKNQNK